MACAEAKLKTGVYRPRSLRISPLYQCVHKHSDEMESSDAIHRPIERQVLERFIIFVQTFGDLVNFPYIRDKGEHLVRYYGWYSSRAGGVRRKHEADDVKGKQSTQEAMTELEYTHGARSAWARLIQEVYEVDPLTCPHCGSEMRFMAVIEEVPVIEQIPLTYGSLPDIAREVRGLFVFETAKRGCFAEKRAGC